MKQSGNIRRPAPPVDALMSTRRMRGRDEPPKKAAWQEYEHAGAAYQHECLSRAGPDTPDELPDRSMSGIPPAAACAVQLDRSATDLAPFRCRPLPLKFKWLAIGGGREGAKGVLQAQGWKFHLLELGLADS